MKKKEGDCGRPLKFKERTNRFLAETFSLFLFVLMKSWQCHDEIFTSFRWNPRRSLGWNQIRLTSTLRSRISSRKRFHPPKVDFTRRRRIWLRDLSVKDITLSHKRFLTFHIKNKLPTSNNSSLEREIACFPCFWQKSLILSPSGCVSSEPQK